MTEANADIISRKAQTERNFRDRNRSQITNSVTLRVRKKRLQVDIYDM